MKTTIRLMLVAVALALVLPTGLAVSETTQPAGIPWLSSFDAALQLAKQQDKPILLDFYNPK